MSSNSDSTCTPNTMFNEIVSNSTGTRVCGINSGNSTVLESCCDQRPIQTYKCTRYCQTLSSMIGFVNCLTEASSEDEILGLNPFCQEGITSNNTQTLTSNASHTVSSSIGSARALFWLLVFGYVAAAAQGTIIPSLATKPNLDRRQDAGMECKINIARSYNTTRNSRKASPNYTCQSYPFCAWELSVQTDILENNRTINGTSAAEPQYDGFFDMLRNQTGRAFPALSSLELTYGFVVSHGDFFIDWTPYAWCINATVTNCEGVNDDNDEIPIIACGPVFVSDGEGDGPRPDGDQETIQGLFNVVRFN